MWGDVGLRIIFMGITVLLAMTLSYSNLISVIFAVSISHVVMAFYYSKSQRKYLMQNWRSHSLPLLFIGSFLYFSLFFDSPPIHLLFGFHHICNELYLVKQKFKEMPRSLQVARIFLVTTVYLTLTRVDLYYLPTVPEPIWQTIILASGAVFFFILFRTRKKVGTSWVIQDFAFEGCAFLVALWSAFNVSATLDHILMYHFLLWMVIPIPRILSKGKGALEAYLVLTVLSIGICVPFTPLFLHLGDLNIDQMSYITRLFGYFHFITSYALSPGHPYWINRWFFKKPEQIVAPQVPAKSA